MTISVSTGTAFGKIQQPFFLKPLSKLILGNMFNLIAYVCNIYKYIKEMFYIYNIYMKSNTYETYI